MLSHNHKQIKEYITKALKEIHNTRSTSTYIVMILQLPELTSRITINYILTELTRRTTINDTSNNKLLITDKELMGK
jgi:hypothetical protein